MKRILLILSVMLIALPAIADGPTVPSDPTYYQPGREVVDGCGAEILGENLNATEVTMVPQYTPICVAGKYSDTSTDPNGVCTNCSGTGKYCPGMTADSIKLDPATGLPDGNQGIEGCPDGYKAGVADENSTSIYTCQKRVFSADCNINNFRNGTMAVAAHPNRDSTKTWPLMVNYRDVDNHCYGYLECDAGYEKKNVWQWVLEHPEAVVHVARCGIDGKMLKIISQDGTTEDVDCNNGQKPGTIKITIDENASDRPLNSINMVLACSNQAVDGNNQGVIKFGDPGYDNFTRVPYKCYDANGNIITAATTQTACEEVANATWQLPNRGKYCWARSVDFPDQPWMAMSQDGYTDAESCENICANALSNLDYPLIVLNGGHWWEGHPVVQNQNGDYYAIVNKKFVKQVKNGENFMDAQDAEPQDDIGEFSYVTKDDMMYAISSLYSATESNENANYNDEDSDPTNDNPVKVCVPRDVTVTWVGVAEPDNETTCTYNSDMAVPTAAQTPQMNGYTFVGWTVGPVAAPSNNSSENNGSESENNGG